MDKPVINLRVSQFQLCEMLRWRAFDKPSSLRREAINLLICLIGHLKNLRLLGDSRHHILDALGN
ncbi:hypothetical protein B0T39_01000 [Chromobacterium haemolyticum]|nr:hypothetical protein B0T39_01000 [Chromobacterium haemolyticum]